MEDTLACILTTEIDLQRRLETLLKQLERDEDFSVHEAFNTIDKYKEGHISMANLQNWFRSLGVYLIERELHAIIRRIDLDGDGKVSFKEFQDFFENQISGGAHLTRPPAQRR